MRGEFRRDAACPRTGSRVAAEGADLRGARAGIIFGRWSGTAPILGVRALQDTPSHSRLQLFQDNANRSARLDLLLILAFATAMLAPTVDGWIRPDIASRLETAEQRKAAPRPELVSSLRGLLAFPREFEAYFSDTFGLRDVLLRWHSIEKLFVFGVSATPAVILGKDDWMFYARESSMPIFRGLCPASAAELEHWRRALESQRDFLARRGIAFVIVLGPNKETIYPDYVPEAENRLGPTRLDQLIAYLELHSDVRILDLRPALIAARADDRPTEHLYYELGTHWNGRGNYVACREIQKQLHALVPAVKELEPSDVRFTLADDRGDSEAGWMYVGDLFPQRHVVMTPSTERRARVLADGWDGKHPRRLRTARSELPRAVVLHDSFGVELEPVLGECFSDSTWLFSYAFDPQWIEAEHPDVVIELFVERLLLGGGPEIIPDAQIDPAPASMTSSGDGEIRYRLDPGESPIALQGRGQTRLEHGRDEVGEFIAVVTTDGADTLLLPAFEWPSAGRARVEADITSPVATYLTLFYLRDGETEYSRQHSASATLVQGRNHVHLEIPEGGMHGRLRIRPGADIGRYLLRDLEVRTALPR